jgi:chromosomal replication initiation ATPase DnaA
MTPPATIINAAAQVFPVTPDDITGPSRRRNETDARFCVALIMHQFNRAGNLQIAQLFNRNNHSSGHYMHRRGADLCETDKQYRGMVERVVSLLGLNVEAAA